MVSVEQVMKDALSLPSEWRAWLAEKLVESLECDVDENLQALWVTERLQKHTQDSVGAKHSGDKTCGSTKIFLSGCFALPHKLAGRSIWK